ncbi:MAG: Calx-beta domain-containing protein [Candidatus Peribacteraceae bacterium]
MSKNIVRRAVTGSFLGGILLGVLITSGAGATYLGSAIFRDVQPGTFYDAAVGEMYGAGIIKGYTDSTFGPDDYVTRGQIAVLMKRLRDDLTGGGTIVRSSSSVSSTAAVSSSRSSAATVTSAGGLHFTASTFNFPDTSSKLVISVIRSGGSRGDVTVQYDVSGGTAVAGTDYTPISGTLTFEAGDTAKNISVSVIRNTAATGNRTMNLTLSNPTGGAVLSDPFAAVITLQKSGASDSSASSGASSNASSTAGTAGSSAAGGYVAFSAAGYGVIESAGTVTVTVMRSGATSAAVGVGYSMANGTAYDGSNYTKSSGNITFAAGETTKTFTVAVVDHHATVDGSKNFTISLANPTGGAALGGPATTTVTIFDEDSSPLTGTGVVRFVSSSNTVRHSDGFAYIPVNRAGSITGTVNVNFETVDNTASNLADYTRVSATLTFAPGETQKMITVPLIKRTGGAGDKQFYIRLSGITGPATMGTLMETTVSITD